jgi:hypothetical protein
MFIKKHLLVGLVVLAIFWSVASVDLNIENVEREVLINGLYPSEKILINFTSKTDPLNTFNHIVS